MHTHKGNVHICWHAKKSTSELQSTDCHWMDSQPLRNGFDVTSFIHSFMIFAGMSDPTTKCDTPYFSQATEL